VFIPLQGAFSNVNYPGKDLPDSGRFEYSSLEEAKTHLFEYVDYIRDVYDVKSKRLLQQALHRSQPTVYPEVL
jgi:hypothetical protein